MYINTSVMQNCGFEDLAQWPSPRPSLKHFVRVEMDSDWPTRIYRSILAEQISAKSEIWSAKLGLRALHEPAII